MEYGLQFTKHFEIDARMSMIFIKQLRAILCSELLSEAPINTRTISGITTITAFLFLELWKKYVTWIRRKTSQCLLRSFSKSTSCGEKKAVKLLATLSHPVL